VADGWAGTEAAEVEPGACPEQATTTIEIVSMANPFFMPALLCLSMQFDFGSSLAC
jgi:hypothetical protein